MDLTNEIRRTRQALKLLDSPGSYGLLSDLLLLANAKGDISQHIKQLQARYQKKLETLLDEKKKYKQMDLDYDE